jgi:four helix bundle protein
VELEKPHTSATGEQIKSYKDLIVWQKGHSLTKGCLTICRALPENNETRVIRSQLIRSATSLPANIAEGYGSYKGRGFTRYLRIARGTVTETEYWLYLLRDLRYIDAKTYEDLSKRCIEEILMLNSLIKRIG